MVGTFGGTASDQGSYGPVGAEQGSAPEPQPNQGPPGPQGPNIDRYAATRIVSADPDQGTDLTIQAAINNLPTQGGTIFVKQGIYDITETILLPIDRDVVIEFSPGSILNLGSNAIAAFMVPDGLSTRRVYEIVRVRFIGNGTAGQEFLRIADTNGYADVAVKDPYIFKPETLVNFTGYDLGFTRLHRVKFVGGYCIPNGSNSTLIKTPHPAGTYFGPVVVAFEDCSMADIDINNFFQLWFFDADADITVLDQTNSPFTIKEGSACNGFQFDGMDLRMGNGDFTVNGFSWRGPSTITGGVNGQGFNARLVLMEFGMLVSNVNIIGVSIKVFFTAVIQGGNQTDPGNLANPGIELAGDGCEVTDMNFGGSGAAYAAGCIKIVSASFCKVANNHFATVTGKTVLETGTTDKCCIHDNTNFATGTGNTVNINGGDQVHNNIN